VPNLAPSTRHVTAGGLRHRLLEWDGGGATTVVLVHGFLDCGGSFGPLVHHLPEGLHCVAPDMRGHGGTEGIGPGGYYHFPDYLRDLRDLVDQVVRERLVLVGHSMGGGIASLFAGAWPDDVHRLVLLEGLGPPAEDLDDGPRRLRRWVAEVRQVERGERTAGRMADLEAAARKLRRRASGLDPEMSRELAGWLTRPTVTGELTWSHDPLHRTRTPISFRPEVWAPFLRAIACPVLTVAGGRSWYRWPELDERRAQIADHRHLRLPEATHMLHHEAPEQLGAAITAFLDGREPEGAT
jgi:pimeloyl-ACP methyl ester carboxylesterase